MRNLVVVFLLIITVEGFAQTKESDNIRLHVLRLNRIGKTYKFNTEDSTITYLKYLGKLGTTNGKTYKLLNSIWIWGSTHRATSRILVYSNDNNYVGNYNLSMTSDLPDYIRNNKLVFINKNEGCDSRLITYLNFIDGIPKQFFRKCKGDSGDIYTFSKD